ncbi:hypothetical protein FNV43_RR04487 [Rhamnella rubrinervis]|uniref:Uncharacterized protein n=1 Tax=Rhamnella rubrinervis TaxID=2594499 RepID=A0A8K0MQM8_9ROSA|nr:hypothetical protein FNV43_RR04487 [Rhamnella rubrinervis]
MEAVRNKEGLGHFVTTLSGESGGIHLGFESTVEMSSSFQNRDVLEEKVFELARLARGKSEDSDRSVMIWGGLPWAGVVILHDRSAAANNLRSKVKVTHSHTDLALGVFGGTTFGTPKASNLLLRGNDQDAWNLLLRLFYSRDLPYDTLFTNLLQFSVKEMIVEYTYADFDLTGQLVWPGAMLLNDYISKNAELLQGWSVIELGSGVGITGILCSRFCCQVVLTDHNEEVLKILKKNVEFHSSSQNDNCCAGLATEKLEWGNSEQICHISEKYSKGFDLILGADIYILTMIFLVSVDENSILPLFCMLRGIYFSLEFCDVFSSRVQLWGPCTSTVKIFILSRMDLMVINEARQHGLQINEIVGTRSVVANLEGAIFEVTL